jgi:hypothetical protein
VPSAPTPGNEPPDDDGNAPDEDEPEPPGDADSPPVSRSISCSQGTGGISTSCSNGHCLVCRDIGCFYCASNTANPCANDADACGQCRELPSSSTICLVETGGSQFACPSNSLANQCAPNACAGCTKL